MGDILKIGTRVVDTNYSTRKEATIIAFAGARPNSTRRMAKIKYDGFWGGTEWTYVDYLCPIEGQE